MGGGARDRAGIRGRSSPLRHDAGQDGKLTPPDDAPRTQDALRLEKSAFVASPATIVRPPVQGQSRARAGTAASKRKASSIDEDDHAEGAPVQKLKAPVDA
jgi:hypothetical protein